MTSASGNDETLKILIAKPGLDGHDRGARIIVRSLREAGFDVSYTGIRQTPDQIAGKAASLGVSIVGLSILSGAHMELVPQVFRALERHGCRDLPVVVGGIIPEQDRTALLEAGVVAVLGPGSSLNEIAEVMRSASRSVSTS